MILSALPLGPFETNGYLLEKDGARLLIDPGAEDPRLLPSGETAPVAVLLTHGHIDHIGAVPRILEIWPGVPVFLHAADRAWAFEPANGMPPFYEPVRLDPGRVLPLPDDRWSGGPFAFDILCAPGHTPGGVCYHDPVEGVLFTGDTLFEGSVGRTDLPGGDARRLTESLRRLAGLPPGTRVYPGHGPATTIGRELSRNYFLAAAVRGGVPR